MLVAILLFCIFLVFCIPVLIPVLFFAFIGLVIISVVIGALAGAAKEIEQQQKRIEYEIKKNGGTIDGMTINLGDGYKIYFEGPRSSVGKFVKLAVFGEENYSVKFSQYGKEIGKIKITGNEVKALSLDRGHIEKLFGK